jgi:hypothetical protein
VGNLPTMDDQRNEQTASAAAVAFATTEHFNLETARASTITEANGRAVGFLAVLSSTLIALGFIGQMSQLGTAFYAFALVLLPAVATVGVMTFGRLVQLTEANIAFSQRIAQVRAYYVDTAPELRPYLTVVSARPQLNPSTAQLLLTVAGMVGFVNSAVVGSAAGILVGAASSGRLAMSLAAGVPIGLATLGIHLRRQTRARVSSRPEAIDVLAVAVPA